MKAQNLPRFGLSQQMPSDSHPELRYKLTKSRTFRPIWRDLLDATIGTCFIFSGVIKLGNWGAARDAI